MATLAGSVRARDLAPAEDGGLWILEREPGDRRYWRMDRFFRVVSDGPSVQLAPAGTDDFKPLNDPPRQREESRFPLGTPLATGSPPAIIDAIAILGLPDGSALLLDAGALGSASVIRRYRDGLQTNAIALERNLLAGLVGAETPYLKGYDFDFVPNASPVPGIVSGE